jgi:hypothetical protein
MGAKSVTTQKLPDGTTQWNAGGFITTLRQLAPGVLYSTAVGSGEHVFNPALTEAMEAEVAAHGRTVIFVNLLEATRLGAEARDSWAAWAKKHRQQTSAHLLVRSKLVEMGLSLIAMFSGADLKVYTDLERFLDAMRQAAPKAALPKLHKVA